MTTPRETGFFHGHAAAEKTLQEALRSGRMPHAWIISGPRGIGKASLCYRFVRALLAGEAEATLELAPENPVFRRIAAGSHTDLLVIEPLRDEKKEEAKREISVEQAREIASFLSLTPGESSWRAVIIDSVDALNVNAANAILKIVEEPPPRALLLLISHNPGKLLPTLRSRCRQLKLSPLPHASFERIMETHTPDLTSSERKMLGNISGFSPGIAKEMLAQDGLTVYREILSLLRPFPVLRAQDVQALAERIAGSHAKMSVAMQLLLSLLAKAAKRETGEGEEEQEVLASLLAPFPARHWAELYAHGTQQFSLAARVHLDYKAFFISFCHSLSQQTAPWNRVPTS